LVRTSDPRGAGPAELGGLGGLRPGDFCRLPPRARIPYGRILRCL